MPELSIPGGGFVTLEGVPGFGGSPERAELAGRELVSIAGRLRAQSRTSSVAGARATRNWQGSASIAYARRNNGHVRSTASGAGSLDRLGMDSQAFGRRLRRILDQGKEALRTRERLTRELHQALRDRRHLAAGTGGELAGVDTEIAGLRRRIRAQEQTLRGLNHDLVRLRKKFGDDLNDVLPRDLSVWYQRAKDGKGTYADIKTFIVAPAAAVSLARAAKTYRAATRAGDARKSAAAMRQFAAARSKLLAIPGRPLTKVDQMHRMSQSRFGQQVLGSRAGQRVDAAGKVARVVDSRAVRALGRYAGPVGVVATIHGGATDAVTGAGKDGVQGTITRATGAGAVAGTVLIVATGASPIGAGAVAIWLVWKGGMALFDRSRGYRARPDFKDDTRPQRMRRFRMEKSGVDADPTNVVHRLYVDRGIGPMPVA